MRTTFLKRRSWFPAGALALAGLVLAAGVALGRGAGPGVALAAEGETGGEAGGVIAVTGQATVKATPDTANLSLGVVAQAASAGEAMDQCSAAMNRVVNAVVTAGVPRANVQTTGINLYPQYEYDDKGGPGRIVGYQAQNQITLTWNQIGKIGDLIDAAVKAGANTVYGIGFSVADTRSLYLEAIGEAVRDAKAKADALAGAAGCRIGAVKNMSLDSYVGGPVVMRAMADAAGAAPPVEPGTVEIQVNVRVEYGIQ